MIVYIPKGNVQLMEKFVIFALKRTVSKFAAHVCILHILTKSGMIIRSITRSITLPSKGIPVSYKIDTGAQCNLIPLTILKKFDPEPDFCPVNIKFSTYNNSKITVFGKCLLALKHQKDHFDVSFIVVNSISVPVLRLATSESVNMIKCISAVNVSDEQLLIEFSDCFGEIGTLKNTHHIEIKDNATLVVTPVRKVPLALKPKLEKELKRMADLDIKFITCPKTNRVG